MSSLTLTQSTARLLETSFRSALALAFAADVASGQLSLWVTNEDLATDPDSRHLPALVFTASVKDWDLNIKVGSRYAQRCQLKIECRAAGNAEQSAPSSESLLIRVRNQIEDGGFTPQGWQYLYLDHAGHEETFKDNARVLSVIYEITALAA